jgi:hypothetical protein
MTTHWIAASEQLPEEGKYVLVHLTKTNWIDDTDHKGVCFKVAKLEKGISLSIRQQMRDGDIGDPIVFGQKRSMVWTGADEGGNNMKPYAWRDFGPGDFFGQEVDYWMEIPKLP